MDTALMTLGATVTLIVALVWASWWLVARTQRNRRRQRIAITYARRYRVGSEQWDQTRPAHMYCGQGDAVTVAELLDEARERGEATRLNWPANEAGQAGRLRPYALGQLPTAILPIVNGIQDMDDR